MRKENKIMENYIYVTHTYNLSHHSIEIKTLYNII